MRIGGVDFRSYDLHIPPKRFSPLNHDAAREGAVDDLPGADARPQSSGIAANKFQRPTDQQQVPLEKTTREDRQTTEARRLHSRT